jgi:Chemoreceptor zinc-binding domain
MDFDEAVGNHTKWKRTLRQYVATRDGSLRPTDVSLDHKCLLGRWIYGEGCQYAPLPEFAKLKYEHARFHMIAAGLVKKANAGESVGIEMEPCSNSEFSLSSTAVVCALVDMKKRLSDSTFALACPEP